MIKVAIVGGGPGGLMAAYLLEQKCDAPCEITVFEASERVGGKIMTRRFDKANVTYEAGVAELYGYSQTGPDPLRDLIVEKFGLQIVPMDGETVVLGDKILRNQAEIKKLLGAKTLEAIRNFRKKCQELFTPEQYYEGHWQDDNDHDWADVNCQKLLDEYVTDPVARKYLKVAAHSDLATEPHLTNGLNGLKNFLMDIEGFIELYSIVGGNEQLIKKLEEHLEKSPKCEIKRSSPVARIEKTLDEKYRVTVKRDREIETYDFDLVAVALPNNWVNTIDYGGEKLSNALLQHHAYYDHPAHYVRVTILFKKRYWQELITDSWFMSDAFGGCCVYD
jgi:protoporphyrinogen oxidase